MIRSPSVRIALRITLALLAFLILQFMLGFYLQLLADTIPRYEMASPLDWAPSLTAVFISVLAARYIWRLTARPSAAQPGLVNCLLIGVTSVGGFCLAAGYFPPLLLQPHSPYAPMLGVLITGPIGMMMGATGGAIYCWRKRRKRSYQNK